MSRLVRLGAMIAVAALALLGSTLALVALNAGGAAGGLRLAAGYDRAAQAIFAEQLAPAPAKRAQAVAASRSALAQYPYDTRAAMRIVYADGLEHGGLSPAGVAMLRRSYDLVAVDPDNGPLRVAVALENSQSLPRDLRQSARNEVIVLARDGRMREQLKEMTAAIRNPAGRLSLALWLTLPPPVTK